MKIEWLVDDVIAVGSPDRVEHAILGMTFSVFWSIQQALFCGRGGHFVM